MRRQRLMNFICIRIGLEIFFYSRRRNMLFGDLPSARETIKVRSHGSRYEARVPLVAYGRKVDMSRYAYNLDLSKGLDLGDPA